MSIIENENYAVAKEAPTNIELASALAALAEAAGMASKASEDFLTARDRWHKAKGRLDDMTAKVNALREQFDPPVSVPEPYPGVSTISSPRYQP